MHRATGGEGFLHRAVVAEDGQREQPFGQAAGLAQAVGEQRVAW